MPTEESAIEPSKGDLTGWLILRFKQLIRDRTLAPGYKLPSERDLAMHFGVSRTSLRPVMKVLEIMGVVSQRVGDGTYLSGDASSVLSEPLEFFFLLDETSAEELIETRLMVEPRLAALAAEKASAEQRIILRESIAEMKASGSDQFRLIEADLLFHRTIIQSSGNRLCSHLFQVIHRSMFQMIQRTSQIVDRNHTLAFHRAIYDAIAAQDPVAADRHMRSHMIDARELLVRTKQADVNDKIQRSILSMPREKRTKKMASR